MPKQDDPRPPRRSKYLGAGRDNPSSDRWFTEHKDPRQGVLKSIATFLRGSAAGRKKNK